MKRQIYLMTAASAFALVAVDGAQAQTVDVAASEPQTADASATAQDAGSDIVVTGIRHSLERAADIKRDSVQVVDAIVATDIGKLPDPTTAAALQRVPGVQVSTNRNNELADVRIRGLPDVLTTVNGREVFTTTGRNFDLQDMPAEALARVNVFKSQTADLIEGGLAGDIDLELNHPFNFTKPTFVLSGRANYGARVNRVDPQVGALATDRWNTGIGEIGALINGTYSKSHYYRATTVLFQRRSAATTPFNTPGLLMPGILQNFPQQGYIERKQLNGALQWKASPSLEAYVEGFYTYFRDHGSRNGANIQPFSTGTTIDPGSVKLSDRCIDTYVRSNGNNPVVQNGVDANGNPTQTWTLTDAQIAAGPVHLCEPDSITFNHLVSNQTTQARDLNQRNKQIAGGLKYNHDGLHAVLDAAYQTSEYHLENITADTGQYVDSLTLTTDVDGTPKYSVPGDALLRRDALIVRNALIQNFTVDKGKLFQVKGDVDHDFDGVLSNLAAGVRYAHRSVEEQSVNLNQPLPNGTSSTPGAPNSVLVDESGLPYNYLTLGSKAPDLNGGTRFYIANPDFLLSEKGLDAARAYFGLPAGQPDYDPGRQFDATENTLAAYLQGKYSIGLGSSVTLDGVAGVRYVRTERTIGTNVADNGVFSRLTAKATDSDFLPDVTARLKFDNGLQFRLGYSKTIRRPNFGDLNPAITLNHSNNPLVQSTGGAGNPDLKEQKSQSYDATLEYYFKSGYIAVAGYYRDITNRVINSPMPERIGDEDYAISRPRNVGQATLKGIEVSSQYFLDFLPGALSGFGVQGAFTFADSKVGGGDPLAGFPLQGVSKYNYTAGLLYDKFGLSGRLVYTYRSKYFSGDATGEPTLRPITADDIANYHVPPLVTYARPEGRLDFNIGYDINEQFRIDVGGTNILRAHSSTYYGYPGYTHINNDTQYNETTYSVGLRMRI
jgi:TonB-dependent receptor